MAIILSGLLGLVAGSGTVYITLSSRVTRVETRVESMDEALAGLVSAVEQIRKSTVRLEMLVVAFISKSGRDIPDLPPPTL